MTSWAHAEPVEAKSEPGDWAVPWAVPWVVPWGFIIGIERTRESIRLKRNYSLDKHPFRISPDFG
jgi:hypothetical protein